MTRARQVFAISLLTSAIVQLIFPAVPSWASAGPIEGEPDLAARYAQANALLAAAQAPLLLNANIVPHWVGDDGAFWYMDEAGGHERVMLADASGNTSPVLDATQIDAMLGRVAPSGRPTPVDVRPGRSVTFRDGPSKIACDLSTGRCALPITIFSASLSSPDGHRAAFVRDDNLWVRDTGSGTEEALTRDGSSHWSWGKVPDVAMRALDVQAGRLKAPPWGFRWSPDGKYLIGGRSDERDVAPYPLLESVPQDGSLRPRVHEVRQALVGEVGPTFALSIFDVEQKRRIQVDLPARNIGYFMLMPIGWSRDGTHFYLLQQTYAGRAWLTEVETATGRSRTVLDETIHGYPDLNASFYSRPNVRVIDGGRAVIWYSERSGWGHLYRYDIATGALRNTVTKGNWAVRDIIAVDERRHRLFFTAGGRESGDPYRRYVYRVDFDGSELRLLTPEAADHMLDGPPNDLLAELAPSPPTDYFSPDRRTFVDRYATLDRAPVTVLRDANSGRIIATLAGSDTTRIDALGLRAPEPFVAKAADGKTDLYGVIFWPTTTARRVPVIDAIYGGPQLPVVPHNYPAAFGSGSLDRHLLATLGFAVVVIDGRGTPQRSRNFHSETYGNFADVALDDHVAVLRELGRRYRPLDLDRVGVFGHSFGGYVSTRALLRYPDFYKVGVSGAGSHVFEGMPDTSGIWLPAPDYGEAGTLRPTPNAIPANYAAIDNTTLAARLKGKLLLAYGDLDENAWPTLTLKLADAFNKADRPYDLLYTANASHGTVWTTSAKHRMWDYFVEHLMGAPPPPRTGR